MKRTITKFNHKFIENGFFERFPLVNLVPSKVKSYYKRKLFVKEDRVFYKDIKETMALFREEGFSKRIIKDVPLIIGEFNKAKPVLDRLAKN
ncbi:MAG TPA: hypothetical protein ENI29_07725 [bacterium]|nr:hypothetical protein [bacterium]